MLMVGKVSGVPGIEYLPTGGSTKACGRGRNYVSDIEREENLYKCLIRASEYQPVAGCLYHRRRGSGDGGCSRPYAREKSEK